MNTETKHLSDMKQIFPIEIKISMLKEYDLSPSEASVYCLVENYWFRHHEDFEFKQAELAEKVNMSVRGLQEVIKRLKAKGLISITRKPDGIVAHLEKEINRN